MLACILRIIALNWTAVLPFLPILPKQRGLQVQEMFIGDSLSLVCSDRTNYVKSIPLYSILSSPTCGQSFHFKQVSKDVNVKITPICK